MLAARGARSHGPPTMKTLHVALALGLLSLVACGDDSETTSGGGGSTSGNGGSDAGSGGDASNPASSGSGNPTSAQSTSSTASGEGGSGDGGSGTGAGDAGGGEPVGDYCTLRAADRERFVVIGHPYDDNANPGNDWEVLGLSSDGLLRTTGKHFQMGEADDTPIAFTANGAIGLAAQEDGTLGVFSLAADGTPTVIDPAWGSGDEFYLNSITLAPEGDHFLATNVNWPDSGGGLYRIDVDCETGELSDPALVIETKNAWALVSLEAGRWAIGGTGADGVEGDVDVHVVSEGDPWVRDSGADPFEEDPSTPQALGAARDGSFVVVGNYSLFGTNEVALVGTDASGAEALGDPLEFGSPYGVAVSPDGSVAIVTSAEGDQIGIFDIDPDGAEPISLRGPLDAESSPVLLPGSVTMVTRGSLDGLVLVVELQGVRTLRFEAGGEVSEDFLVLGAEDDDFVTVPYGIGVQP